VTSPPPAVDLVVPCYNYAHYLEACVASILTQTGVTVRVLIIDDCSTDDTPAAAARLAAQDSRVSVLRNEVNLGLIGTANRGMIDWVEAPYSLLISADDALTPGALARATTVLQERPEAGFVFGAAVVFDSGPPPALNPTNQGLEYRIVHGADLIEHICQHGNDVPTPTAVVRTGLQKQVGGYNPQTPHTSDMEMWLRLATRAKVGVINAPQGYYRVHGSNMSATFSNVPRRDAAQRILAARLALLAADPPTEGFADAILRLERREAREACRRANLAFEVGAAAMGEADLRFAAETDPRVRLAWSWWAASVKRALGPRRLARLRAICRRPAPSDIAAGLGPTGQLSEGQLWGWWPGGIDGSLST